MSSLLNHSAMSSMSSELNRVWHILSWNIRGMNKSEKWPLIRNKIEESNASIVCLQETKKANFDAAFIKNFAPKRFDKLIMYHLMGPREACWCFGRATCSMVMLFLRKPLV